MARAQKRDAVHSQKFYFRKGVFPPGPSQPSSVASSCPSTPVSEHGGPILVNGVNGKEKKLRNCYPLPPKPEDAIPAGAVEDEYEEMSMVEIMNGKVPSAPGAVVPARLLIAPSNRALRSRGCSTWCTRTWRRSTSTRSLRGRLRSTWI